MRNALVFLALGFVGCDGGDDTDTDIDTDSSAETVEETTARKLTELLTLTTAAVPEDATCWSAGDAWLIQAVNVALQVDEVRTAYAEDFQDSVAVVGATISLFNNDDLSGTADTIVVTDDGGEAEVTAPSCTPIAVKVIKEGTHDTYESHQIFEPIADNDDGTVNSVSNATFTLIPAFLGVSVDDDKSVIAGSMSDCNGDSIEGVQIVVRDATGNIPDSLVVNYFTDDFPDRDQVGTSADGLWIAMNVPVGDWFVEAYVSDGAGGYDMIGTTELTNFADTIGISNIHWGFEGGVWYPESCIVGINE